MNTRVERHTPKPCLFCSRTPDIVPHSTEPVTVWHENNICILANMSFSLKDWNRLANIERLEKLNEMLIPIAEHVAEYFDNTDSPIGNAARNVLRLAKKSV